MSAASYDEVVNALAEQLRSYSGLEGVRVEVEIDEVQGLPDDGGRALIVESMNRRPSSGQPMSAGRRLRNRFSIIVTSVGFDMESFRAAAAKRDALLGQVELAVLDDRTIGGMVANLEIQGGEFYRARALGSPPLFAAVAETVLEMDLSAIS